MPGSVIQLQMNFGYPGSYSRMPDDIVIAKPVNKASGDIPFGNAVMLNDDNTVSLPGANLTADNFMGIAVREVKQGLTYGAAGVINEGGAYQKLSPCDVLARGNTVIKLGPGKTGSSPKAGDKVLYRTAVDSSGAPQAQVGDFEAGTPESGKTIALPNVVFTTGELDANNVIEVSILTRNNN